MNLTKLLKLDGKYNIQLTMENHKITSATCLTVNMEVIAGTFFGEYCVSDLATQLNTIELDKMMDETNDSDDFHKRKY